MFRVACFDSKGGFSLPDEIVYIPEGENKIVPFVNGEPKEVIVKLPREKGAKIAAAFQRDMDRRLKANVRPTFDFDHKPGKASAIPQSFRYQEGVGLMAKVEWTGSGSKALKAKDYSYFSPEFLLNEDGTPDGLAQRGPLGGLVNEPAFRNIPRIAAKDGTPSNPNTPTMSELVQCGLLNSTEAAKDNAPELARNRVTALRADADLIKAKDSAIETLTNKVKDLEAKVEASDAAVKDAKEASAKTTVQAAAADGRIAPKDEKTQDFWIKALVSAADGDTSAQEALASLPKKNGKVDETIVKGANGEKISAASGDIMAESTKLIQAGRAKTNEEAFVIISQENPDLYESYNQQFASSGE